MPLELFESLRASARFAWPGLPGETMLRSAQRDLTTRPQGVTVPATHERPSMGYLHSNRQCTNSSLPRRPQTRLLTTQTTVQTTTPRPGGTCRLLRSCMGPGVGLAPYRAGKPARSAGDLAWWMRGSTTRAAADRARERPPEHQHRESGLDVRGADAVVGFRRLRLTTRSRPPRAREPRPTQARAAARPAAEERAEHGRDSGAGPGTRARTAQDPPRARPHARGTAGGSCPAQRRPAEPWWARRGRTEGSGRPSTRGERGHPRHSARARAAPRRQAGGSGHAPSPTAHHRAHPRASTRHVRG